MRIAMYQGNQLIEQRLFLCNKILDIQATIIELIEFKRFPAERNCFLMTVHPIQNGGFKCACLCIVPITQKGTLGFVKRLTVIPVHTRNLCACKITGILPTAIPSSFIETVIGFLITSLIFEGKT